MHLSADAQNEFYYGFDSRIPIIAVQDTVVVRAKAQIDLMDIFKSSFQVLKKFDEYTYLIVRPSLANVKVAEENDDILSIHPVFRLLDNTPIFITEEIISKARPNSSERDIQNAFNRFRVTVKRENGEYVISSARKGDNSIKIANKLYETGLFVYAYPNFYAEAVINQHIPNDQYFGMQFYLYNTGQTINDGHTCTSGMDINVTNAWDLTKGAASIIVAVIDEGVTSDHPDLPNSRQIRLNGSNFASSSSPNDPSPVNNENHGNACAGIIAATQDNNEGISGVAPGCTIMPVKVPFGTTSPTSFIDAINFAVSNGAHIISNSWGYSTSVPNFLPALVSAIGSAISAGRAVVFAAGNTAAHSAGEVGYVNFPACANLDNMFAIGACDRNGNQSDYSPTDTKVDFVAPSHKAYPCNVSKETFEVWTIDIPNTAGYNEWHNSEECLRVPGGVGERLPSSGTNFLSYTGRMGGTSSSCPEVAGVIALMLSANPCLSLSSIKKILQLTSKKIGGVTYVNGKSDELGYGLVDAYEAVKLAKEMTTYLQNKGEAGAENYLNEYIKAGKQVTNLTTYGDYLIKAGADITIRAKKEIVFEDGFDAQTGSKMDAYIETGNPKCNEFSPPIITKKESNTHSIASEPIKHIEGDLAKGDGVKIYPNPMFNQISVDYYLDKSASVTITLTNIYGQIVHRQSLDRQSGSQHETISDLSSLAPGMYLINVCWGNSCVNQKITKDE